VSTFDDHAVAVGHRLEQARWEAEANGLLGRVAGRFVRVETRRRAGKFVRGEPTTPRVAAAFDELVLAI